MTNDTNILQTSSSSIVSSVTGTISPLPTPSGTFTGVSTTTYTATIDGTNNARLDYNSLVGGVLTPGDTITGIITGATGILLSDNGTQIVVSTTAGSFSGEAAFSDTTSGASALVTLVTAVNDSITWTDGTTTVNALLLTGSAQLLSNGISATFTTLTGNTIGQNATWTYTIEY